MLKKLKNITGKSGSFRRNVMIMSGGSMINILISLGLYPIVTRLYTKADFGGFGLYMAVASLLSLAGTALYPTGLVIPKYKRDFFSLLKLSFILMLISVVATILFVTVFKKPFTYIFKLETLGNLIYFIPLGVLLMSAKTIFVNWNIRNKDFVKNASSNIVSSSSLKGINIGNALINGPSSFGLIISQIISTLLSILTLGSKKFTKGLAYLKIINKQDVKIIAKKYIKYPKFLLPGNLINKYTSDLPIYLITAYFSPSITGAFVLANTMMNLPLNVLGSSISSVFLQKSNELYVNNPKELSVFGEKVYKKLLLVGSLVFGFLFAFGDLIFAIYFGKKWSISGQIAGILSIYFVFKLVSGPMAKVYRVVGKEYYSLYVSAILAVCRSVGMIFGVLTGDPIQAILYFTIANVIGYLINSIFVFKAIKLPIKKLLLETILIVVVSFTLFYGLRQGANYIFNFSKWLN